MWWFLWTAGAMKISVFCCRLWFAFRGSNMTGPGRLLQASNMLSKSHFCTLHFKFNGVSVIIHWRRGTVSLSLVLSLSADGIIIQYQHWLKCTSLRRILHTLFKADDLSGSGLFRQKLHAHLRCLAENFQFSCERQKKCFTYRSRMYNS